MKKIGYLMLIVPIIIIFGLMIAHDWRQFFEAIIKTILIIVAIIYIFIAGWLITKEK